MDRRLSQAVDRHITGNYGEDQYQFDGYDRDVEVREALAFLPKEEGLCPVCGYHVKIITMTKDGRLVGGCGDAFPYENWVEMDGDD